MPKNVAAIHAQVVRGAELFELLVAVVLIAIRLGLRRMLLHLFQQFGIENRRADAVCAACPLAKVNESTSIATEREVLVGAQHNCLAGRAT
jgi:hypothetical protein